MPASRTADRPATQDASETVATEATDITEPTEVIETAPSNGRHAGDEVAQLDLGGNEVAVTDGETGDAPIVARAAAEATVTDAVEAPAVAPKKPRASRAKKATSEPATPPVDEHVAEEQPLADAAGETVLDATDERAGLDASASADAADATGTTPIAELPEEIVAAVSEDPDVAVDAPVAAAPARTTRTGDEETDVDGEVRAARDDDEPRETFESLGLTGPLLLSLREVGYEAPSPIQIATIPDLLKGRDVIAQAQTGSGKTAAFGLPIIERIDADDRRVQALILCPTRELAIQVAEALHKYGKHKNVQTLPIYGGQAYERQFRGLQRGVQIVVGTPGRVMDHMRRGSLVLEAAKFFVLDEADEMLDMGFIDDVDWILGQVPAPRQMALFSATMPPRIEQLARNHMTEPARISVRGKEVTVSTITQSAYEVPRSRKIDALNRILDAEEPQSAMIFCRTKNAVDELGEALLARGYAVDTLHGDLSQAQRDRVMRRFRGGQAEILIATDVAARGLDIPDVSHVINFDIPESTEAYVHRVGRTGRAGKTGEAITLVSPRELRWLRMIERATKGKIDLRRLPSLADVADRRREAMKTLITDTLRDESGYEPYLEVIEQLAEDQDMSAIAAAVLKLYADETGRAAVVDASTEDDLATFGTAQRGRGEQGMTRLFLNIGRNQGIRPQDIVGAIANEANIPGRSIGAIDILDQSTFVDVPTASVDAVMAAMPTIRLKGRPVSAEVSTEAPRTTDRGDRPERGDRDFGGRGGRPGGFGGDRGPRRFDRNDRGPRPFNDRGGDRGDRGPRPPFAGDRDRGPQDGRFGFDQERNDRGPRRFDRDAGPSNFDRPREDRPREDRPREDRPRDDRPREFDRGPRNFDRGSRDDRGPREFNRPAGPRDGDRNDRGPRQDGDGNAFDRPRRAPEGQQPYRPFRREDE